MCICINCRHLHVCSTYQLVNNQHEIVNREKLYTFDPEFPIINVNISKDENIIKIDWDVIECLSFSEQPGKWLKKMNKK